MHGHAPPLLVSDVNTLSCYYAIVSLAAGATGGTTSTKIFPAPTRPLKTKRDPKKLRMAGGQVWEDHSLDDWDHSKLKDQCFIMLLKLEVLFPITKMTFVSFVEILVMM